MGQACSSRAKSICNTPCLRIKKDEDKNRIEDVETTTVNEKVEREVRKRQRRKENQPPSLHHVESLDID